MHRRRDFELLAGHPGVGVGEVCRRHGLAPSGLSVAGGNSGRPSAVALKRDAQRKDDLEAR